ncbi:MAG: hypothetical protein AB7F20_14530 [Geoalkalibacter sp.]|uniref:hypothetical protein n=1 Tax=Geoalkalibacter sp. TaxID=3041440 RepID=UPI003D147454
MSKIQRFDSRTSRHGNQTYEYVICDDGIRIVDAYAGKGEVLTGSARRRQEALDALEAQRLAFQIESRELDLRRLRLEQEQTLGSMGNNGANMNPGRGFRRSSPKGAPGQGVHHGCGHMKHRHLSSLRSKLIFLIVLPLQPLAERKAGEQ